MSRWFDTYGFGEVHDDLIIGAYPLDQRDVAKLERQGVDRVLNLVEDEEYGEGDRHEVETALKAAGIEELRLRLIDYGGLSPDQIDAAVQMVSSWLDDGQRVYLHCRAGWQRSAAVGAGVVALREDLNIEDALVIVQVRKPSADPLPHQREDLRRWWDARDGSAAQAGSGETSE